MSESPARREDAVMMDALPVDDSAMHGRLRRRQFLETVGQAAVGIVLLSPRAGAGAYGSGRATDEIAWRKLIVDLETRIPKLMARAGLAGLSLAVVRNARLAWIRGFGVKDRDSKAAVDDTTVFEAGSMSKPVFAYAVLKLCEKGVLALDRPLTKYTPQRFVDGDPRLDGITARHVLSHTSGFQNWRSDDNPLKIHFTPGTKFQYSGEGYSYLQSVVTHLARQPIEAFMKANVLEPFGMTSSGYVWTDTFERLAARPHDAKGRPLPQQKSNQEAVARYAAAGALLSTPTDMANFLIEVIAPKDGDTFRLGAAMRAEMLRPHVKVDEGSSWALGWAIHHAGGRNFLAHGGDNKGFHAFMVGSVDSGSGYVLMTNGDSASPVMKEVMRRLNAWLAA